VLRRCPMILAAQETDAAHQRAVLDAELAMERPSSLTIIVMPGEQVAHVARTVTSSCFVGARVQ